MEQRQWAIVTIAGGIAIAIGSVLPWVNLTSGLVGTISMAGTEGDGILTLGAGIIVALLGAAAYARGSKTAAAGQSPCRWQRATSPFRHSSTSRKTPE